MGLAGHCSGLYQTIRDEGAEENGRGALNFLGGLVQVLDDPANDESEVHIGKQPDLTDLFLTANAAPELTLGIAGKTVRVRDDLRVDDQLNVGSNGTPGAGVRARIITWHNLGVGASTMLQQQLAGTQTANAGNRRGFDFAGAYDLAGFNLTDFMGVNAVPTVDDSVGTSVLTTYYVYRGGIDCRPLTATPDASVFDAIAPSASTVATRGHAYRARNQGFAAVATAFGYRAEEQTGSPACRPFQDEGSDVGDPHGNRYYSNTQYGSLTGAFAGGDGVVGIADRRTAPSGTPAAGGVLWSESGELKWTDSGGNKERVSPVQVGFAAGNGNNNDCAIGEATLVRITGPTAAFTLTGIAGGTPGRRIVIYNTVAQNMSITHEDANSAAANRIRTMDALTHTTAGEGAALLEYDATTARWVLVHMEG